MPLPPKAPGLNPVEQVWQVLWQRELANRGFDGYDAIVEACQKAWNNFANTEDAVSSKEQSQMALSSLDNAIVEINSSRAKLGALQNRLGSIINTLSINEENYSAANSRIRDVDIASETADMAKNSILNQAGVSVLAQANQSPNYALKLLG